MKRFKVLIGFMVCCFFPSHLGAQLSLDDCQRLAEQNYPLLEKYDLIRQTTDYSVKNIQQGYLPKIKVTGQSSFQNEVPSLPSPLKNMLGSQGYEVKGLQKDHYRVGVEISQMVWDGGNVKMQQRLAGAQGRVEMVRNDVQLYGLRTRINELYFGLLWLEEQISLSESQQQLLSRNHARLVSLEKKGMVMQADVDAVHAESLKSQQQICSLKSLQGSLREVLVLFIGKPVQQLQCLKKPEARILENGENRRPELLLFDAQKEQLLMRQKFLSRLRYPQISLFAQGGYGYPGLDFFEDMFHHDWKWTALVGLRFRWELSNFYTQKYERRKLQLAGQEIDNAREVFLFNSRLQATQQRAEMLRYQQMLEEDDEIIRLRTSVREAAENRLEKGVIDVVQLLQEITKEHQAQTERAAHEIEMLKHLYELKITLNQ